MYIQWGGITFLVFLYHSDIAEVILNCLSSFFPLLNIWMVPYFLKHFSLFLLDLFQKPIGILIAWSQRFFITLTNFLLRVVSWVTSFFFRVFSQKNSSLHSLSKSIYYSHYYHFNHLRKCFHHCHHNLTLHNSSEQWLGNHPCWTVTSHVWIFFLFLGSVHGRYQLGVHPPKCLLCHNWPTLLSVYCCGRSWHTFHHIFVTKIRCFFYLLQKLLKWAYVPLRGN